MKCGYGTGVDRSRTACLRSVRQKERPRFRPHKQYRSAAVTSFRYKDAIDPAISKVSPSAPDIHGNSVIATQHLPRNMNIADTSGITV